MREAIEKRADGVVDERETEVLERQISTHALFAGLLPTAARTLIDLANDAIKFAGSAGARVGLETASANSLPSWMTGSAVAIGQK